MVKYKPVFKEVFEIGSQYPTLVLTHYEPATEKDRQELAETVLSNCPRCGVSYQSYWPVSKFDDKHHLSRDGERPLIRCADIVNKKSLDTFRPRGIK